MSDKDDLKSLLGILMGRLAEKTGTNSGDYGQQLEAGIDRLKNLISAGDLDAARQSAAATLQRIQQAMGVFSEVVQALASTPDAPPLAPSELEIGSAAATPENDVVEWCAEYSSALVRGDDDELARLVGLDAPFLDDDSTFGDIVNRLSSALVEHDWERGRPLIRLLAGTMLLADGERQISCRDGLVACFAVLARQSAGAGQLDDAVGYANRAREVASDAGLVHAVRAEIHIAAGQLGAAERKVELAFKQDAESVDAWIVKGMCAEAKQDVVRAQSCYRRAAELHLTRAGDKAALDNLRRPRPPALIRLVAKLAAERELDLVALHVMEQLDSDYQNEERWPEQIQDARLRADSLRRLGRNEDAADALCDAGERTAWMNRRQDAEAISREAVELAPAHQRSWSLLAHLLVLRSYDSVDAAKWIEEGRRSAEVVRRLSAPQGMGPYAMRTWAAIEEREADLDPANRASKKWAAVVWVERAWLLDRAGGYQGALLGRQLRNAGVPVLGRREAQRAYQIEPIADLAREEYLIGAVNFGDYEAAEEVLDAMPNEPWVVSVRVVVLSRTGRYEEARPLVDTLLIDGTDSLAPWQTEAFAQCMERTGSPDDARALRAAMWDRRSGITDLLGLAEVTLNLGLVDEAMELLDRYERAETGRAGTARFRGMALLRKGLLVEGTSLLRLMIEHELNPEELVILAGDLDRLADELGSVDIKPVMADIDGMLESRARTLILTDLVAAELDDLPAADTGMTDPESIAIRLVRARYAAEAGRWGEAMDRYRSLAVDLEDAREVSDALLTSVASFLQAGDAGLDAAVRSYSTESSHDPDAGPDTSTSAFQRAIDVVGSIPSWPSGLAGRPDELLATANIGASVATALRGVGAQSLSHLLSASGVGGTSTQNDGERLGREIGGLIAANPDCLSKLQDLWRREANGPDEMLFVESVIGGASSVFDRFFGSGVGAPIPGAARIRVLLGRHHVPENCEPEAWQLLGHLLPELRMRVRDAAGIALPAVKLVEATDLLPADDFAVQLDGQMVTGRSTLPTRGDPPLDPMTGEPWPWTGPNSDETSPVDTGSVSSQRFVSRHLAACVAQRLDVFIGPDAVADAVNSDSPGSETEFAATVAALSSRQAADWIEALMRDLAADGYPTGRWRETPRWPPSPHELIGALQGTLGEEIAAAADRIRSEFRDRLAGNDSRIPILFDEADMPVLARICRGDDGPAGPASVLAVGEITEEVNRLTERHGWYALVVADPAERRAVRAALRAAGVYVPVLTQHEILSPADRTARTAAAK